MIQIIRGKGKNGRFRFYALRYPEISGFSRCPLLDAARQLKSLGLDPVIEIGLFREGVSNPDLVSTIGEAGGVTVSELDKGKVKFIKYREFQISEAA